MIKKLNMVSLAVLSMSWQPMSNAVASSFQARSNAVPTIQNNIAIPVSKIACMSAIGGFVPVPGQKNTFTRVTVGCGVPAPSGFTQQLPAGAIVIAAPATPRIGITVNPAPGEPYMGTAVPTIQALSTLKPTHRIDHSSAPIDNQAILPEPVVSQIKWHAMGYRYPDGHGGMVHVDEKDKIFYIFVNGRKMSSGPIPSGKLQKRPPMYIVYDWLLQKWQANRNDNASYYLAPTAECALSRNMSIGPDGALSVQLIPQPQQTGATQWMVQGYQYPTYSDQTVYVNDKTGKSYIGSGGKVKFDLPDVPTGKLQKRPPMYIVYDWLLQKWQANRNDNASYYLAPTAECALSRNMSIGPDGALSVQLVPQPPQIGPIKWTVQIYQYPTYGNCTVYVNAMTGQSYIESSDKIMYNLPNVPQDLRQKRPAQVSPVTNGPVNNHVMPLPIVDIVAE